MKNNPRKTTISIRTLSGQPRQLTWDRRDEWVEAFLAESFAAIRAADGQAAIAAGLHQDGHSVFLNGKLAIDLQPVCDRCAKSFAMQLQHDFELVFLTPDSPVARAAESANLQAGEGCKGGEWGSSDDGAYLDAAEGVSSIVLKQDTLDLVPYFKEQALLAVPMTWVCQAACPGLCPRCGVDLSAGQACDCAEAASDPRWQALKKVQIKD